MPYPSTVRLENVNEKMSKLSFLKQLWIYFSRIWRMTTGAIVRPGTRDAIVKPTSTSAIPRLVYMEAPAMMESSNWFKNQCQRTSWKAIVKI